MATVLEEFLVSIRYAKDAASEEGLLKSLERIGGKVGVVAASIIGLGVAIFKLTEHFAELADASYFMAQRLGSTVADIDATTWAMTQFGTSTEEAKGALEGLGAFTRNYGSAATGFMRGMGITASDTEGRLRQLGDYMRRGGFRPGMEGTDAYAMMLRYGHLVAPGASEQALRAVADPKFGHALDEGREIQREVFGIHGEGAEAERQRSQALERITEQGHKMAETLSKFGFMFSTVMKVFGGDLFTNLQPQFERLFKTLEHWLPTITGMFKTLAAVVGVLMSGFNDILLGFDLVAKGVNWLSDAMGLAIPHIDGLGAALIALGVAASMNPFVLIIAGLIVLLAVLDDFRAYMQGGKHVLNWEGLFSGIETLTKKIGEEFSKAGNYIVTTIRAWGTAIDEFVLKWTGISLSKGFADFHKWVSEISAMLNSWVKDKTGIDVGGGINDFIRMITGVDLQKLETWKTIFQTLFTSSGMQSANELGLKHHEAIVKALTTLRGLLIGDGTSRGLIGLMGDFLSAMSSNILQGIATAWERIAEAVGFVVDKALAWVEKGHIGDREGAKGSAEISGVYGVISGTESGNKDVENPETTTSGHAQGYFQITTGTWKEFAPKAGIDLIAYPQALGMPAYIQARVASVIPLSRWDPKTRALVHSRYPWVSDNMTIGEIAAKAGESVLPTVNLIPEAKPPTPPEPAKPRDLTPWPLRRRRIGPTPENLPPAPTVSPPAPTVSPPAPTVSPPTSPAASPLTPPSTPTNAPPPLGQGLGLNDNYPMFAGNVSPMIPGHMAGGADASQFSMLNDTDIHVYGSTDPVVTARAIGEHQNRVASNMARLGQLRFV